VTPIGQQNPPGPLKLLGLREKTGKNTDSDFAQITLNILVYVITPSCGQMQSSFSSEVESNHYFPAVTRPGMSQLHQKIR
jgi:hypothetical protein